MTKGPTYKDFVIKYLPFAKASALGTPIFTDTILSAAYLESNKGMSQLTRKENNFFGVKAPANWPADKKVFYNSIEFIGGKKVVKRSAFKKYSDPSGSFDDYIKFIRGPRYQKAGVLTAKTPAQQLKAIAAAGYATDPGYYGKLITILKQNKVVAISSTLALSLAVGGLILYKKRNKK